MLTSTGELERCSLAVWDCVTELAVTVFEDHPADTNLVMIDDLMDHVSELQAAAHEIRLAVGTVGGGPVRLVRIDAATDAAVQLYWRDLRGFRPIYELRRAARQRGTEWRTWAAGVEAGIARCEEPITALRTAIRAAWRSESSQRTSHPGGNDE